MTDFKDTLIQDKLIQVMLLRMRETKTVKDACDIVGISPGQYYEWHKEYPDTMLVFRGMLSIEQRMAIDQVLGNRLTLLQHIIDKGIESPDPLVSIQVYRFLNEVASSLNYNPDAQASKAQQYISDNMPELRIIKSKLASVDIQPGEDGSLKVDIYKDSPVIDAGSKDAG